jgi:hypothetical protein
MMKCCLSTLPAPYHHQGHSTAAPTDKWRLRLVASPASVARARVEAPDVIKKSKDGVLSITYQVVIAVLSILLCLSFR